MIDRSQIRKDTAILTGEGYNTPNTSLIFFHFEPIAESSLETREKNCLVKQAAFDGKDLYLLDGFFTKEESFEMQSFSKSASFSRQSYGSPEAIEKGQKGAKSMNGKERWKFFSNPPEAVQEVYRLLGSFAHQLDADISTLPWELCDQTMHGSPAVIANFLEESSHESMGFGKHQDSNPEEGIPFGIPILYEEGKYHPNQFANGKEGNPWLITLMLYTADPAFSPDYQMGTAFYQKDGSLALRANCLNMRIVFFEGDIFHTMEESNLPPDTKTWRVSYVFKLVVNPRKKEQCVKKSFQELMGRFPSGIEKLSLGPDSRA